MTDLEQVQQLIQQHGNARRAALAFNARMEAAGMEYRIDETRTMQRIAKGEARPALVAFVRYIFSAMSDKADEVLIAALEENIRRGERREAKQKRYIESLERLVIDIDESMGISEGVGMEHFVGPEAAEFARKVIGGRKEKFG